jgi:undecaprenyl-diphosphatase
MICIKKYRTTGILCLSALLLTTLLGEGIIKHLVQRQRPYNHIDSLNLLISEPMTYSFPSGHTGSSFAAATVLGSRMHKLAPWVFSFAVIIAFSRLYLMVHYATDVLAGAALGTLCAVFILRIYKKRASNDE